ncbi:MAG: type II toxin-antitoxin system YafQ family toxin [Xanthomonadaceae bacterium]|nr:type II toxin-antitoxin system YafQ family toxin [Xanthomonadaceae bacterium]
MARKLANDLEFSPRFKRDYGKVRKHPEFDRADAEALFEDLASLPALPAAYNEHPLEKRAVNWSGYLECHLSGDIVVIYTRSPGLVRLHRIGGHAELFGPKRRT